MHVLIWEYQVGAGRETEFEKAYGPNGDWVALFQRAQDYLGTELLRNVNVPGRYVTIDRWVSIDAYDAFREKWIVEYKVIDACCDELTERELLLGRFDSHN